MGVTAAEHSYAGERQRIKTGKDQNAAQRKDHPAIPSRRAPAIVRYRCCNDQDGKRVV